MFSVKECQALVANDEDVSVQLCESGQHLIDGLPPDRLLDDFSVQHRFSESINSDGDVADVSFRFIDVKDPAIQMVKVATSHPDRDLIPSHAFRVHFEKPLLEILIDTSIESRLANEPTDTAANTLANCRLHGHLRCLIIPLDCEQHLSVGHQVVLEVSLRQIEAGQHLDVLLVDIV